MKKKTRKTGIKAKLLIPVITINIAICIIIITVISLRLRSSMIEMGREQAMTVAEFSASSIDANKIVKM